MLDVTQWERVSESSGTKVGFWIVHPVTRRHGLVKIPKYQEKGGGFYQGEAWAEVLSSKLASKLSIPCPEVEPVLFEGIVCPLSWDCKPIGWELREGVTLAGIDKEKEGLSFDDIVTLLSDFLEPQVARKGLIHLACLDILTGNTDRHWENWGVLIPPHGSGKEARMAPFYDNGSGFASNWGPSKFEPYIQEEKVQLKYDENFRYEIRFERNGPKSRICEILDFLLKWDPHLAGIPSRLLQMSEQELEALVQETDNTITSDAICQFSMILLKRRRKQILERAGLA